MNLLKNLKIHDDMATISSENVGINIKNSTCTFGLVVVKAKI